MTPSLPLAELVKELRRRSRDPNWTAHGEPDGVAYTLDYVADELEAALPLGRCETCREWDGYGSFSEKHEHGWCAALKMTTMRQFGCTTYAPAPPAAGEETR